MASELYEEIGNQPDFMTALNQLKAKGGNPEQMIQQLMNSGRVSQAQYNAAAHKAQQILKMLGR